MANFYRRLNDPTVYQDEAMTRGIKDEAQLRSLGGVPDWGPNASQTNIRTIGGTYPEVSAPTRTLIDVQGSNPRGNSYQIFNSALMDMLKKYQTLGTKPSQMTQIGLRNQQADKVLATAEGGFSPSQQSSMRNAEVSAIQPSITGSENRQQTYEQQLGAFGNVLNASRDYAQSQMEAQVKHEEDTRKSIQDAINTYGSKAFEGLDEKALSQLEKDANYPKGYLTRKSKTIKEQELAISQQNANTAAQKTTADTGNITYKDIPIDGVTHTVGLDEQGNMVQDYGPKESKDVLSPEKTQAKIQMAEDTITLLDKINDDKGFAATVNANPLEGVGSQLWNVWGNLSGQKQEFIADVEQLISSGSLNALIDAKSKGATFGALSDKELDIIGQSYTKIKQWQVREGNKPDGKVTGYNVAEGTLREEIKRLREASVRLKEGLAKGEGNKGTTSGGVQWEIVPENSSFQKGSSGTPKATMRTDRSNNPTAFTTDIARIAGLKEGTDYTVGDSFGGGKYHTAKLIGDPVAKTIAVIDKIGFYTQGGKQRWTHTAIPQSQWNSLNYNQKKQVIKQMYQKEGNQGLLNQFFA
jgi:hypothetical protein